ncbi:MAG TPA: hypothetical protein VI248_08390 [Kineosporiaceae bacterium]
MTRSEDWADYLDPAEPSPALPPQQRGPLDRVTSALATEAVWSQPPAGLRTRLLETAAAEAANATREMPIRPPARPTSGAPVPAPVPAPVTSTGTAPDAVPPRVPLRRPTRRRWILAAAGVAAAAALIATLAWPRSQAVTFAMSGTALAPGASARAELEPKKAGLAITLQITGLAPAPAGEYYAAWLSGPRGIVPVGTFHWRQGGVPINLWSGVGTDLYRQLFVTLQHEGRPPTPTSEVVLTGTAPG